MYVGITVNAYLGNDGYSSLINHLISPVLIQTYSHHSCSWVSAVETQEKSSRFLQVVLSGTETEQFAN